MIDAVFIDGSRVITDRTVSDPAPPEWKVARQRPYKVTFEAESVPPGYQPYDADVYDLLGILPNGQAIYGRKKDGLTAWHIDQYFRGPVENTLLGWEQTIREADRELHTTLTYLSGVQVWPNKPQHPPFVTLFSELRFLTDGYEVGSKPYLFMYHRRSQGVGVKRVM